MHSDRHYSAEKRQICHIILFMITRSRRRFSREVYGESRDGISIIHGTRCIFLVYWRRLRSSASCASYIVRQALNHESTKVKLFKTRGVHTTAADGGPARRLWESLSLNSLHYCICSYTVECWRRDLSPFSSFCRNTISRSIEQIMIHYHETALVSNTATYSSNVQITP